MLGDNPQATVPSPANSTAVWLAPRLPITLHNRPYSGVNVHVARSCLGTVTVSMLPQEHNLSLRRAEPAGLVGFFEFGRYGWYHWDRVSAGMGGEGPYNVRVATRVAESREIV